jgi:predicted NAD-dependent protein-ADP-ribosyltransferase YbiA (DUF1768 family)
LRRLYPRLRNPITSFTGKHDFLALDFPVEIVYKRKKYPSVAAVMKAEKTRLGDTEYRANLKEIVGLALHYKFTEHEDLQQRLLDTGEDDIVTTPAIVGELLTLLRYHLAAEDGDEEEDGEEEEEAAPAPRTARTSTRRAAAPPVAPSVVRRTWKNDPVLREKMERLEANAARIPMLRLLWPETTQSIPFRVGRKVGNSLREAYGFVTPRGKKKRREWLADGMAERSLRYFVTMLTRDAQFRDALLKTGNFPLVFREDIDAGTSTYSEILTQERERVRLEAAGRERLAGTTAMQPGRQRVEGEDVVDRLRGLGFRF